jgi:hypothetical protein
LSVKPGRKLIKALVNAGQKIEVVYDNEFKFNFAFFQLKAHLNEDSSSYNNIFGNYSRKPAWVSFAHELIHALHHVNNKLVCKNLIKDHKKIIRNMDDFEEQQTIVGFVEEDYLNNKIKCKIDILCENAFLLALGLPPRCDHHTTGLFKVNRDYNKENCTIDTYCEWLEDEISRSKKIPSEKVNDKACVIQHMCDYPKSYDLLPEKWKNDEEFIVELMLELYCMDNLDEIPKLHNNKELMLKLIDLYPMAIASVDVEFYKDKIFALKFLEILKNRDLIVYYMRELSDHFERFKEDPDFQMYFNLVATFPIRQLTSSL